MEETEEEREKDRRQSSAQNNAVKKERRRKRERIRLNWDERRLKVHCGIWGEISMRDKVLMMR